MFYYSTRILLFVVILFLKSSILCKYGSEFNTIMFIKIYHLSSWIYGLIFSTNKPVGRNMQVFGWDLFGDINTQVHDFILGSFLIGYLTHFTCLKYPLFWHFFSKLT